MGWYIYVAKKACHYRQTSSIVSVPGIRKSWEKKHIFYSISFVSHCLVRFTGKGIQMFSIFCMWSTIISQKYYNEEKTKMIRSVLDKWTLWTIL